MNPITRREALKAGIGAAVGAAVWGTSNRARAATQRVAPGARAFATDDTGRRHAPFDGLLTAAAAPTDLVFSFSDRDRQQSIVGFGAALTEAACTVLSQLPDADRAQLLDELYNPDKTNFGIGRLCIGASDYSTTLYSYDEGEPDPTLSRFSIDHDRAAVIPVLKQARAVRSDLYLFASPWSPPGWMKYSNSMKGGSLRPHNVDVYAHYIVRYLQAYRDAGVAVDAMTIQNEIDADQDARMPACTWAEETAADYIVNHLGPLVKSSNLPTKIWLLDHNYNLIGRVLDQLARPGVRDFIDAVAWHGYAGSPDEMMQIWQHYPSMNMHWTEGGDELGSDTLASGWGEWASRFAVILNNGVRSITTWNLALDENGKPNIGPFSCAGMLTIDSKSKTITRNGIYWALAHYSKAMPRGSRLLKGNVPKGNVQAAAARRPDGTVAVVLANSGQATRVQVDLKRETGGAQSHRLALAENSVVTLLVG